jgi:hypothetical protein
LKQFIACEKESNKIIEILQTIYFFGKFINLIPYFFAFIFSLHYHLNHVSIEKFLFGLFIIIHINSMFIKEAVVKAGKKLIGEKTISRIQN